MEHGHMPASTNSLIISLQDKHSPLPQQHWFGTIDYPQLVANAYNRTVAIYWNTPRETGNCLFTSTTFSSQNVNQPETSIGRR
ncbi:hypothetical protein PHYBLDRAFT_151909 [Phycomyces blakesleeanus NRRL 1555(-)]|uniref:Uncharacterized protein n=1 Tax=Phycomyces blakesleeanus (strain ATCC 8743b / DSM 1359 / FGSC 10004 / NBRC 33097 / NRRL 1555) TaxID=763407 RepID=A0A167JZD2_PHYB8|nr:hypothetical protein PHYBLDRAFT_151909 [Phycomyces blakesleeanus NRRL 1555(-)]OAD66969.1 hypothetical protein PHYBLDRAFT_151909 [Phycomyces blakesleeanus NRRL 1555(-)]|eukprot:XP_018285009.1 hypothetical protein PHYBLDRAFT_151909 [Phycomyces blakesleeanus NRRL 1555(-)]